MGRVRRLLIAVFFAGSVATVGAVFSLTLVTCGGEGEGPCLIGSAEYSLNGGQACDSGLRFAVLQFTCVNDTRRVAEVDPWANWALRNQEVLAIDEPINWVSRLGTHNAFNNRQDGDVLPNQWWSMTDQLRLGSRHFELDLHPYLFAVRLCHAGEYNLLCNPDDRIYAYGMKEIRNWLQSNPDQILTVDFEDRTVPGYDVDVNDPIAAYLGSLTFTPAMRALLPTNSGGTHRLPTFREMLNAHRRFMAFSTLSKEDGSDSDGRHGGAWIHSSLAFAFPSGQMVKGEFPHAEADPDNVRLDPINGDCVTGVHTNGTNGFAVFANNFSLFPWVAEDRRFGPTGSEVTHSVVERAVRCGIGIVFLDDYATSNLFNNPSPIDFRHWSAIWSWEPGDRGDHGQAAVLKAQKTVGIGPWKRWNSRATSEVHRFLCGRARSESGGDPLTWADRRGNQWQITTAAGTWYEGGLRCFEEFGDTWVFRAPVSGYQNVQASQAADGLGEIWLNYNDIKDADSWVINKRPFARAGSDQTLECTGTTGVAAHLDASASSDPENDPLKFRWTGDAGFSTNPARDVVVPLGTHTFDVVVDDHFAGVRADSMQVTVQDTTAPTIHSAVPSRSTLWPPNGQMLPVTVTVDATDVCSANVTCRIVSVTTSEPNTRPGLSPKNTPDVELTGPLSLLLRAERLGSKSGRTYTITIRCTDSSGNFSEKDVIVTVPHDQR